MQHLFSVLIAICVGLTLADPTDRSEAVKAHNDLRKKHQAPALTLDDAKIKSAQNWAKTMADTDSLDHQPPVPNCSESIFQSSDLSLSDSAAYVEATKSWYSEELEYDYDNPDYEKCGHFMNMIWKRSKNFGIGVARNEDNVYVCAVYDYPGGTEADNVLPPKA